MLRRAVLLAASLIALSAPALAATPQVGGTAYLVENATTGDVVLAKNARLRVPIASITKLMTVLVALEHARLDSVVSVTGAAAARGESSIFLRPGERLTVRELVQAALIQSANDAAAALADHVGGGDRAAFVRDDEREGALARPPRHEICERRTGSTRRGTTRRPAT